MRELKISASITNRESAGFTKYLQEIRKIELLTTEEESRLTSLIKNGDEAALQRLVNANLRFVVSVAKQYQGHGLSLADLVNEGNIGLMKAARRFDDTRGFKFISYAVWWIRQSILQAIGEQSSMIRLPKHKMVMKSKIQKAQVMLEQQLERSPTSEELAEEMNLDNEEISNALQLSSSHVSLDAPFSSEEENSLLDVLENNQSGKADEQVNHQESLKGELQRALKTLDKRQNQMICWLFGIGVDYPLSMEEIAGKYDVTSERVRQIRDNALLKLATTGNVNQLRTFLGR
ncbi:MAG: polymerase sigma factor rpoD [Chitinophagaceae bacterium]|nr:polymerase sigma factor rpoD [Chitinophagaceae bacterium]